LVSRRTKIKGFCRSEFWIDFPLTSLYEAGLPSMKERERTDKVKQPAKAKDSPASRWISYRPGFFDTLEEP
jgi:hypothetical protein